MPGLHGVPPQSPNVCKPSKGFFRSTDCTDRADPTNYNLRNWQLSMSQSMSKSIDSDNTFCYFCLSAVTSIFALDQSSGLLLSHLVMNSSMASLSMSNTQWHEHTSIQWITMAQCCRQHIHFGIQWQSMAVHTASGHSPWAIGFVFCARLVISVGRIFHWLCLLLLLVLLDLLENVSVDVEKTLKNLKVMMP